MIVKMIMMLVERVWEKDAVITAIPSDLDALSAGVVMANGRA